MLDRSRWELAFDEAFLDEELDAGKWVAHYLPQWSTPDQSAARYDVGRGVLRLRIDADQPPWRDEDGELRVSNIQTATFAGPIGSDRGTHRHRPDLQVRTAVPNRQLFTLSSGLVEARLRGPMDPTCMLAVWLVGVEEASPSDAGEICIVELYGHALGASASTVRLGVKAHHDERMTEDMADLRLDIDATDWHTYAAAWTGHETRFYVDDHLVRVVPQGIDYPLQLMVDLFEFPQQGHRDADRYPNGRRSGRAGLPTPAAALTAALRFRGQARAFVISLGGSPDANGTRRPTWCDQSQGRVRQSRQLSDGVVRSPTACGPRRGTGCLRRTGSTRDEGRTAAECAGRRPGRG